MEFTALSVTIESLGVDHPVVTQTPAVQRRHTVPPPRVALGSGLGESLDGSGLAEALDDTGPALGESLDGSGLGVSLDGSALGELLEGAGLGELLEGAGLGGALEEVHVQGGLLYGVGTDPVGVREGDPLGDHGEVTAGAFGAGAAMTPGKNA